MIKTLGNLTRREDFINNVNECFTYDGLNRLTQSGFNGACSGAESYSYSPLGNIETKTGVSGTYEYGAGNAGPNAVTTANNVNYQYDNAGNMIAARTTVNALIKQVNYTAFNKPSYISANGNNTALVYGPTQDRIMQTESDGRISIYPGLGSYEIVQQGSSTQEIHYLEDWGQFIVSGASVNFQTLHRDHLGSVVAKVDQLGSLEELSNGAWGERRDTDWAGSKLADFEAMDSARGFTDHEHLDGVGLIHMNGRVYDPVLGRFLSPDPLVQAPYNTQSFNRYSYVFNNPLSFVDPSGYSACEGSHGDGTSTTTCPRPDNNFDMWITIGSVTGGNWGSIGSYHFNLDFFGGVTSEALGMYTSAVLEQGRESSQSDVSDSGNSGGIVEGTGVRSGGRNGAAQKGGDLLGKYVMAFGGENNTLPYNDPLVVGGEVLGATGALISNSNTILGKNLSPMPRTPIQYEHIAMGRAESVRMSSSLNLGSKALGVGGYAYGGAQYSANMINGNYDAARKNGFDMLFGAVMFYGPAGFAVGGIGLMINNSDNSTFDRSATPNSIREGY